MKTVEIDMARGFDQTIDPRVAPQGTVARVQNMRIDKLGRLVPRKAYVSLGTSVAVPSLGEALSLRPVDLYTLDGDLICAGRSNTVQTGMRALYKYQNQVGSAWRTEFVNQASANTAASFRALPAADSIRIISS